MFDRALQTTCFNFAEMTWKLSEKEGWGPRAAGWRPDNRVEGRGLNKSNSLLKVSMYLFSLKTTIIDTHEEKAPSIKTPALTESINADIWVVSTLNQLL